MKDAIGDAVASMDDRHRAGADGTRLIKFVLSNERRFGEEASLVQTSTCTDSISSYLDMRNIACSNVSSQISPVC